MEVSSRSRRSYMSVRSRLTFFPHSVIDEGMSGLMTRENIRLDAGCCACVAGTAAKAAANNIVWMIFFMMSFVSL